MSTTQTQANAPRDTVEAVTTRQAFLDNLRLLSENDLESWIALWDEDGAYELPFAPAGTPQRVQGRAKVREYMRLVLAAMSPVPGEAKHWQFWDITAYETTDPRTIIAEYKGRARLVPTGRIYSQTYIARVSTSAAGQITLYREHWNPLLFIEGLGSLEAAQQAFAALEFEHSSSPPGPG